MTETEGMQVPRPSRCRRVCESPAYDSFAPAGVPAGGTVRLTLDEYEAIRLIDLEGLTHEETALRMEISRTTVTEICQQARRKLADCLVNGRRLVIAGGNYRLCDGGGACPCQPCPRRTAAPPVPIRTIRKGTDTMRIAVTYENGNVFQHFGHTAQFKLYDAEGGKVLRSQVVDTNGQGHGALAGFLTAAGVDTLICGGIGGGAQAALANAGIRLFAGVSGPADQAVEALLAGSLAFDPNAHCDHHVHGEGHHCGEHHCGEDKHGCAGHGA